jgi:hypothetical protein
MSIWVWASIIFIAYIAWTIIAVVHLFRRFGNDTGPSKILTPPLFVLKKISEFITKFVEKK